MGALLEHTGLAQDEGDRAGAIVGAVVVPPVSPSSTVRSADDFIGGGDGALDSFGSLARGHGFTVDETDGVTFAKDVVGCVNLPLVLTTRQQPEHCHE